MTLAFDDGSVYDDEVNYHLGVSSYQKDAETTITPPKDPKFRNPAPEPKNQDRIPSGYPSTSGENKRTSELPTGSGGLSTVDREHDVPLAASALVNDKGEMYGVAIDKHIPPSEYDQFVMLHEAAEYPHMKNLIDAGQNPIEAYHEAHDKIATPTETAAVRAYAARNGKDPDEYLEQYKQHWRDGASQAALNYDSYQNKSKKMPKGEIKDPDKEAVPTSLNVHPDAHTTRYGLDKAELGTKIAMMDDTNVIHMSPAANDNKNLQIPDNPYTQGVLDQQWNNMVKEGKKPVLTIVPKDK